MAQQYKVGKRSTTVAKREGVLRITYHSTVVVEVAENGDITLNTGGWKTQTTKNRMNQAANQFDLPFSVFQKDFRWFVKWDRDGSEVEFGGGISSTHTILSGRAA